MSWGFGEVKRGGGGAAHDEEVGGVEGRDLPSFGGVLIWRSKWRPLWSHGWGSLQTKVGKLLLLGRDPTKHLYYSSLEVIYIYILTPTIHECCMSSSGLNRWFLSHRKQPSKKLTNVGSLQPIATEMSFVPGQCFLPHEFATILGLLLLSDETMKLCVKMPHNPYWTWFQDWKQHWKGFGFGVSSLIIVKEKFNNCCKKTYVYQRTFFSLWHSQGLHLEGHQELPSCRPIAQPHSPQEIMGSLLPSVLCELEETSNI